MAFANQIRKKLYFTLLGQDMFHLKCESCGALTDFGMHTLTIFVSANSKLVQMQNIKHHIFVHTITSFINQYLFSKKKATLILLDKCDLNFIKML